MKKPRGPMPKHIREFLADFPELPWHVCACECGRWFSSMDHHAPFFWEMNYCKKCGYLKDRP